MGFEYKFMINGNEVDEPIGWNDSKRKLKRSEKFKYLFVDYIPELTFHGTGYDILLNLLETNGFCSQVSIYIYYRCGEFNAFEKYFYGLIRLDTLEIDEERCQIKCDVENDTYAKLLNDRADVKVKFNATKSIGGGMTLPSILKSVRHHHQDTGAYDATPLQGYFVNDAFNHILEYISDGRFSYSSSFFGTLTSNRTTTNIVFTNPTVDLVNTHPISSVAIFATNYFNQTTVLGDPNGPPLVWGAPKTATVAATLQAIVEGINRDSTLIPTSGTDLYYRQDFIYPQLATHNSVDTITLTMDLVYDIINVTGASVSPSSLTPNTLPSNGKKYLTLLTGNQLRKANTGVPEMSFAELFEEMDKLFGLGMSLTSGGVITIEPLENFFGTTTNISLTNVVNLKYKISRDFTKDLINVGDGADVTRFLNLYNLGDQTTNGSWIGKCILGGPAVDSCSAEKADLTNKFIVDMDAILKQIASVDTSLDSSIYLLEAQGPAAGQDADTIKYENFIHYVTTPTNYTVYAYNAQLTNYWKITNWLFQSKCYSVFKNYFITNTSSPKIIKEYEFDYQMSKTDADTLINNNIGIIKFNSGTNLSTEKDGWVKEIDFDNRTGKSHFKLLTIA